MLSKIKTLFSFTSKPNEKKEKKEKTPPVKSKRKQVTFKVISNPNQNPKKMPTRTTIKTKPIEPINIFKLNPKLPINRQVKSAASEGIFKGQPYETKQELKDQIKLYNKNRSTKWSDYKDEKTDQLNKLNEEYNSNYIMRKKLLESIKTKGSKKTNGNGTNKTKKNKKNKKKKDSKDSKV